MQVKLLRDWNGELRYLQNFKLCRLGKKHLQETSKDSSMDCVPGEGMNLPLKSTSGKNNPQNVNNSKLHVSNVPSINDNNMDLE